MPDENITQASRQPHDERAKTMSLAEIIKAGRDLLNEQEAAEFLDITPGTLSVWRSTGRYSIPYLKVGRNVRYRRGDLLAWLDGRVRQSGATA